ncbi:MAG TPA: Na-translocating system protein MpsC family protein, partial [Planococcus sp. (in: firmicutes)]|nr:Na-translocating system protein MpsC family protein [Planococcus sp. (in: firmicutes)]
MHNTQKIQKETGGYISTLLRDYFGKGPSSVFVTVNKPFITFYLSGFLSPTERILLKQNETRRILETRDLLMNDLEEEIKLQLHKIAQL